MESVKYLKEMLGVVEGGIVDTSADVIISAVPQVGQLYQTYQIKQLQKRMKFSEQQLSVLKNKIESSENEVFYKQEVFPLIVKKLMDEDEDVKSKVIIDGFEYIIDNDLNEIERIYHYYDVLSELRYSDIMMLVEKYSSYQKSKNIFLRYKLREEEEISEEEAINIYQKNKLVRLGLIGDVNTITDFGMRFIDFFALEDITEGQI